MSEGDEFRGSPAAPDGSGVVTAHNCVGVVLHKTHPDCAVVALGERLDPDTASVVIGVAAEIGDDAIDQVCSERAER